MENSLMTELIITSPAFENEAFLPSKYTCEGENVNPPLEISGIPAGTLSLALVVEDLDAPDGIFDHWLVWNIQTENSIAENSVPGVQGENSFGTKQYRGPCPPSGIHRYYFKIFALNTTLNIGEGAKKIKLLEAMKGHILTLNELIGKYQQVFSRL